MATSLFRPSFGNKKTVLNSEVANSTLALTQTSQVSFAGIILQHDLSQEGATDPTSADIGLAMPDEFSHPNVQLHEIAAHHLDPGDTEVPSQWDHFQYSAEDEEAALYMGLF